MSSHLGPMTPFNLALSHPEAGRILTNAGAAPRSEEERYALASSPLELVVKTAPSLIDDEPAQQRLLEELYIIPAAFPASLDTPERDIAEFHSDRGRAALSYPTRVRRYARFELSIDGLTAVNAHAASFTVQFNGPGISVEVDGFWHSGATFRARMMPLREGAYSFRTRSDAPELNGFEGSFEVVETATNRHGPVRTDGYHFRYDDGTRYLPIGTTAYAWLFQEVSLQESTLRALASTAFTKLRMCLLPKWFAFNERQPERTPFASDGAGGYDFSRPDPEFWDHLEHQLDALAELGIEADLILYHPYDAWGFSDMGRAADLAYVRYAVARLASFANVWWSLANEHDVILPKTNDDWEAIAHAIVDHDPVGHLRSIHHCITPYDHSKPWISHVSIQDLDVTKARAWRDQWNKPVLVDECGYEGDLRYPWGDLTAQEMVDAHWSAAVRGAYAGHGETYTDPDDHIWWASGGELRGESAERIAFLAAVMSEHDEPWEPLPGDWPTPMAGRHGAYYVTYIGSGQPRRLLFLTDPSSTYAVDVIDTWAMTTTRVASGVRGRVDVPLPGRPGIAVRFVAENTHSASRTVTRA